MSVMGFQIIGWETEKDKLLFITIIIISALQCNLWDILDLQV